MYTYYSNHTNFALNVLLEYPNPLQPGPISIQMENAWLMLKKLMEQKTEMEQLKKKMRIKNRKLVLILLQKLISTRQKPEHP